MQLQDRAAISDVVIAYATALDRRDWALMRSLLCDPVAIDYTSFDPALDLEMPADEWVARVTEGLSGFDATQHLSSNHVHLAEGADAARCVSQMQALHVLAEAGGEPAVCTLHGYYTTRLVRQPDAWRIRGVRLVITARTGDPGVFGRAVQRFHERAARARGCAAIRT